MNDLHPMFADILAGFTHQTDVLHRAADKAGPRRFIDHTHSAFGSISDAGSERAREVRDEEQACEWADDRMEQGEDE